MERNSHIWGFILIHQNMTVQVFQYKTCAVLKEEQGSRGQAQLLEYNTSDMKRALVEDAIFIAKCWFNPGIPEMTETVLTRHKLSTFHSNSRELIQNCIEKFKGGNTKTIWI